MLARLATLLVAGFFLWSGGLQAWDPRHALTLLRVEPDAGASGALMLSLVKARLRLRRRVFFGGGGG